MLRDSDDRPYRHQVCSLAFKGGTDPSGVPATWVVGGPAARAVAVLEQLQPAGNEWLFASLRATPKQATPGPFGNTALTVTATNRKLNRLVTWINTYCAARGRADAIPEVNGKPWLLTTRQFRRTLAWFIARRPGGTVAGAIAYRHLSIQMFEGYSGTSESGFRAEVEAEQALARGEGLLAMIDANPHVDLAGPAADEAAKRLEQLGAKARCQGITVSDPRRLRRLMNSADPAIYPGTYVTCVYDHSKALCQRRTASSPDLATCQPLNCRNVALTSDNTAAWDLELARLDDRLTARPPLPPLLAHQLQIRREQIQRLLDEFGQGR